MQRSLLVVCSAARQSSDRVMYRGQSYRTFDVRLTSQVLSGDSWASGVARSIFEPNQTEADVALFFVSFILIGSVMLLNVVIAILLDEFIATVTRAKEEEDRVVTIEQEKRKVRGCLDQLTRSLITFEDQHDLQNKIGELYEHLDEDGSGGLNFEEFQQGLMNMISTMSITRDDFDVITENGKHLGPTAEFNSEQVSPQHVRMPCSVSMGMGCARCVESHSQVVNVWWKCVHV
jgi:hypothetical protein